MEKKEIHNLISAQLISFLGVIISFLSLSTSVFSQVTFQNVTSATGIENVGTISVSWLDFNNDEHLDLYLTASPGPQPGSLLFVKNMATYFDVSDFANVSTLNGNGVAIGDYNNDGHIDVCLTRSSLTNQLFKNSGDGTFANETNTAGVAMIGSGMFRSGASFVDYDNDGLLDLFVGNALGSDVLFQNQGDGKFSDVTAQVGLDAPRATPHHMFADFNNDGFMDLYVPNNFDIEPSFGSVSDALYLNNGNGTYTDITVQAGINHTGTPPEGVLVLDINNDGFLDIFLTTSRDTRNLLYRNNGDNTFTEIGVSAGIRETGVSVGVTSGDFDNDGWVDIFVANFNGPNYLYWNNGNQTFREGASLAQLGETGNTFTANAGDFDEDGFLDLFTVSRDIPDALQKNSGNNNNWLKVDLVGTTSNRSAIGARVHVLAGQRSLFREINGGNGYGGETLTAEFGVGNATHIDQLEIRWPSGLQEALSNIKINQRIRVIEGQGVHHLVLPTSWTYTFPQSVALLAPFDAIAHIEPQLFEANAKILDVTLMGLGDDRTMSLKKLDTQTYSLDTGDLYVSGAEGDRLLAIKVNQETSIGLHTITLPFVINLTSQIPPKIRITQPSVDFGEIEVGRATTAELVIENDGPGVLLITKISSDLQGIQISDAVIPVLAEGSNKLRFNMVPGSPGSFLGQLTLHTTDPENETINITLEGVGVVTPADPRADFNASGTVDFSDFLLFVAAFGSTDMTFDINGSGSVDFGDFLVFVGSFGKSIATN